ncbi:MAG: hypothetical protein U0P45_07890 [Acidimicrobiales bacterium]
MTALLTKLLGPPTYKFDDVGVECGLPPRSMRGWEDPSVSVGFDAKGRLGWVTVSLDDVSHRSGPIGEGDLFSELERLEPSVKWSGPNPSPGDESDYYDWTIEADGTSISGGLTGPPPDGRLESYLQLTGPYDAEGCGE